jgi:hypothetical protein
MRRAGPSALSIAILLIAACGRRAPTEGAGAPAPSAASPPGARAKRVEACAVPDFAALAPNSTYTIPSKCDLRIDKDLIVDRNVKLVVAPGARLRFARGTALIVQNGALETYSGSSEDDGAVRFTSAAEQPAPGDWRGILVDEVYRGMELDSELDSLAASIRLRGAVIEYAGGGDCAGAKLAPERTTAFPCAICARGAITLARGSAARIRVGAVRFAHVRGADLDVACADDAIGEWRGNRHDPEAFVRAILETAGRLEALELPVHLGARAAHDVALPKGDYVATEGVHLGDATLRLAEGSTLRLGPGASVEAQRLVAERVTFTAATKEPWGGVLVTSASTSLDGCVFERAAGARDASAIVSIAAPTLHHVWDNVFHVGKLPAFAVGKGACAALRAQGNSSEGALCVER